MMGGINTFYTPGHVQTDTSGGPGSPGGDANSWFFQEMAKRRARQEAADTEAKQQAKFGKGRNYGPSAEERAAHEDLMNKKFYDIPQQRELQKIQLQAAQLGLQDQRSELAAKMGPQPMKVTTAGMSTFYSPDNNAMNAYQRKAYLPENADTKNTGSAVPTGSISSPDIGAAMAGAQNTNVAPPPPEAPLPATNMGGGAKPMVNVGGMPQAQQSHNYASLDQPILTPSSASNSPLRNPMSPLQMASQLDQNSRYQSGANPDPYRDPYLAREDPRVTALRRTGRG
jgi:hypothetical protein